MTATHDLGCRALFAPPEMVRELLTGFTPFTLFSLRNSVWAWLKARATRRTDNQEFFDIERMEVADMETTMLSWAEQLEEFGLKKGLALVENAREEAKEQGKPRNVVIWFPHV